MNSYNQTCVCCQHHPVEKIDRLSPPGISTSFDIMECPNCKMMQAVPSPLQSFEYSSFYQNQYHYGDYLNRSTITPYHQSILNHGSEPYQREIQRLLAIKPDIKTILDVGCGIPFFLYFAAQAGMDPLGLDVVPAIINYSAAVFKIKIMTTLLPQANLEPASFDLIRYHHVFEHLQNPIDELKRITLYIKPGGLLKISIPNRFCWKLIVKRLILHKPKSYNAVDPPHHFFGYSLTAICSLMEQFYFRLVSQYSNLFSILFV